MKSVPCSSSLQWASWRPPTWVGECVQAPVTGMCAVPPDILSKTNGSYVAMTSHMTITPPFQVLSLSLASRDFNPYCEYMSLLFFLNFFE